MRHLCIGLCLLALLLGGALGAVGVLDQTAEEVGANLEQALELSLRGETEAAAEWAAQAEALWQSAYGLTASLISHERMEAVDLGFGELRARLRSGESGEFARVCRELMMRLRALSEAERPYFYNFLCVNTPALSDAKALFTKRTA